MNIRCFKQIPILYQKNRNVRKARIEAIFPKKIKAYTGMTRNQSYLAVPPY